MKVNLSAQHGLLGIAILAAAAGVGYWWGRDDGGVIDDEAKPLYWVAPMDPNYRRDKPGKSPMGMDLIPVYQDEATPTTAVPGVVEVAPEVVNAIGVRTETARLRTLANDIATVGFVQYDEDRLVHIHPRVDGWVDTLYVKTSGAPVTKGQPLYTLYSPNLVNVQEELLLAIRANNSRLIRSAEERMSALNISRDTITQIKRTGVALQNITFYAPQDGVVDNLNIREGFFVQPGTTLMSIGYLGQVWVEAEVLEAQSSMVQPSQPVTMRIAAFPGEVWEGSVDYVYPTLDPVTRALRVRLRFDNPNKRLKPGMYAAVTIHAQPSAPILAVPKEAVIRLREQARVVLALGEGRFKSVAVTLGLSDAQWVAITAGLEEGAHVVTSAQFLLDSESSKSSDFKRMEPRKELPTATVAGVINAIDVDAATVNISREAIAKWKRPSATMDFVIGKNLKPETWSVGSKVHFTFVIDEGKFIITQLHLMAAVDEGQEPSMDTMEHQDHGAGHD